MMNRVRFFPVILIWFGVLILIANLGVMSNVWGKLWPTFLIAWGSVKIINSFIEN